MRIDSKLVVEAVLTKGQGMPVPRSYSGRVMYGENCVGFLVQSTREKLSLLSDIKDALRDFTGQDESDEVSINFDSEVAAIFRPVREDAMSVGTIIYFPNLLWDEACEKLVEDYD